MWRCSRYATQPRPECDRVIIVIITTILYIYIHKEREREEVGTRGIPYIYIYTGCVIIYVYSIYNTHVWMKDDTTDQNMSATKFASIFLKSPLTRQVTCVPWTFIC